MHYDVTIGIPVYNVENYIGRTMEAVLAQTYPSVEFLLVDDCSEDKSLDIIMGFKANHSRGKDIRVISHSRNLGVSETRNQIIDEAQGDFLYFMDSDDVISQDTIALLMEQIHAHHADAAFGSYERIGLSGERFLFRYPSLFFDSSASFACYVYRKYAAFQASSCNYLMRLSLIRRHQLKFFKSDFWEDMVFTLNFATLANRVVLLPNITYSYLCRVNSLSNSLSGRRIEKERITQYFLAVNSLKYVGDEMKDKPYLPNRYFFAVMSDIYIICNVLKKRDYIYPSFSNQELVSFIVHPMSFGEIIRSGTMRFKNLTLFLLGKCPSDLCVFLIRLFAKLKGFL